jgi:large subunit ribosomal protein L49
MSRLLNQLRSAAAPRLSLTPPRTLPSLRRLNTDSTPSSSTADIHARADEVISSNTLSSDRSPNRDAHTETDTTSPSTYPPNPSAQVRESAKTLPYGVGRTPSQNLAIYNDSNRGGNRKFTIIKKIRGEQSALRAAIAQELGIKGEEMSYNNLTRQVLINVRTPAAQAVFGMYPAAGY